MLDSGVHASLMIVTSPARFVLPEAVMLKSKLRDLAGRLKAGLEGALEIAGGLLLPQPAPRPVPVRVRPSRPVIRD